LECEQFGPETIEICSSYFYLGLIFNKMEKKSEVKAFYSKIIQIWKRHIMAELMSDEEYEKAREIYYEDAKEYLKQILLHFEIEEGPHDSLTAECNVAFALVMLETGNYMVALEGLEKAYCTFMSALGEFDPKTKEISDLIKRIENMQQDGGDPHYD
jgi:tetratricopeptide (TPR) repeat protein